MSKLSREEVYKIIDSERNYQEDAKGSRTDGNELTVGDHLTMLASYLKKAQGAWTFSGSNDAALEQIRKITGIGVHCLENHGGTPRVSIVNSEEPDLSLEDDKLIAI